MSNEVIAFAVAEKVCLKYFVDMMAPDFKIIAQSMSLISRVIEVFDPALQEHLAAADLEPFFAISWVLAWFSHEVKSLSEVTRIFDAMLCSHPLFSMYLSAAVSAVTSAVP